MAISHRHELPQQPIFLDFLGIDFIGPFPVFNGYSYILLAVNYVSRWVEVVATKTNDAKVVVDFLKSNIFCRFGVPKALISDQESHFCIELPQHTTPRQTTKLKCLIGKSRKLCKRWTRADSLRMRSRHTRQHTRLHWGCLPTRLSSVKPATYQLN
ncbi:gag-pol, partial [Mucuna pruriens]